jgi:TolA-binding protein
MGNENDDLNQKEVAFNSQDIGKVPKEEYFIKTRKEHNLRSFFESINRIPILRGWRKFAILALLLVAIAVPIIISVINDNKQPEPPVIVHEMNPVEIAGDVYKEAVTISQNSSDTAYFDALSIFNDAIEEYDNEEVKIEIKYMKAEFYNLYGARSDAIALLLELNENEQITDAQKSRVLIQLITSYQMNGDIEDANAWLDEFNRLYPGGQ